MFEGQILYERTSVRFINQKWGLFVPVYAKTTKRNACTERGLSIVGAVRRAKSWEEGVMVAARRENDQDRGFEQLGSNATACLWFRSTNIVLFTSLIHETT